MDQDKLHDEKVAGDPGARLVSDAELADLLEAEYAAYGHDVTLAEKEAGFAALAARLPAAGAPPARRYSSFAGPLAMAAMVAVGLVPMLLRQAESGGVGRQSVKGGAAPGLAARLDAFTVQEGALTPVVKGGVDNVALGETVVFKVTLPTAGAVALALAARGELPSVRLTTEVGTGGVATLIEQNGQVFGLRLDDLQADLRVCVVAESDRGQLADIVEELPTRFAMIDDEACIRLKPTDQR